MIVEITLRRDDGTPIFNATANAVKPFSQPFDAPVVDEDSGLSLWRFDYTPLVTKFQQPLPDLDPDDTG